MAAGILRPRDVLASVPARLRRNCRRPQSNSDPKPVEPRSRRSSPKPPPAPEAAGAAAAAAAAATATAKARILKNRKTRMEEMYAGSGFSVSPAPNSVPIPSFSVIRREPSTLLPEKQAVDYAATQDLRRILQL